MSGRNPNNMIMAGEVPLADRHWRPGGVGTFTPGGGPSLGRQAELQASNSATPTPVSPPQGYRPSSYVGHGQWMARELDRGVQGFEGHQDGGGTFPGQGALRSPHESLPHAFWVSSVPMLTSRAWPRHLSYDELRFCEAALQHVTSNNPYLLRAYFGYYSSHCLVRVGGQLTAGRAMETSHNSDTYISYNLNMATASRAYLGGLLIHELAHTIGPAGSALGGADDVETDAYGIEWAINDRFGDPVRAAAILENCREGGAFTTSFARRPALVARFHGVRAFMKVMMDICDNGRVTLPRLANDILNTTNNPLVGLGRIDAQLLVTEFAQEGRRNPSSRLQDLISHFQSAAQAGRFHAVPASGWWQ